MHIHDAMFRRLVFKVGHQFEHVANIAHKCVGQRRREEPLALPVLHLQRFDIGVLIHER